MLSEMFHAAFFYLSSVYRKRSKEFFTPLPSPLKGERQFDCLIEEVGMGYDDFLIEWVVIGL